MFPESILNGNIRHDLHLSTNIFKSSILIS